jgi:hypothetical protein
VQVQTLQGLHLDAVGGIDAHDVLAHDLASGHPGGALLGRAARGRL